MVHEAGSGDGGTAGESNYRGEALGDLDGVLLEGICGEPLNDEVLVGGGEGEVVEWVVLYKERVVEQGIKEVEEWVVVGYQPLSGSYDCDRPVGVDGAREAFPIRALAASRAALMVSGSVTAN